MAIGLDIGGGGTTVPGAGSGTGVGNFSGPVEIPSQMGLYNQSLALNQQNYQNILGAYSGGQQGLAAQLPGIYQGYGNIQSGVQNTLGLGGGGWGVAAPAAQAIGQSFAQSQGQTQQDLINRGLGNSTVLGNLSNQNTLMAAQAYGGLGAQLAQTYAGYQAQIGLAQQAAQMQGLGMQTDLAKAEGATLGGYRFQSPSQLVGQYSQGNFPPRVSGGLIGGSGGGGGKGNTGDPYAPPGSGGGGSQYGTSSSSMGGGAGSSYGQYDSMYGSNSGNSYGGMVGAEANYPTVSAYNPGDDLSSGVGATPQDAYDSYAEQNEDYSME